MMEKLPVNGFKWRRKKLKVEDIINYNSNSDTGCFVEADIHIPQDKHDYLNDLVPFPEGLLIDDSMISWATKKAREKRFGEGASTTFAQKKLAPNLLPKKKYKCHIRTLQYYLSLGGVVDKIHRVLEFKQSDWLASYIKFNTMKRQAATSEFEKSYYKLLNNSFFGKTMEVRNFSIFLKNTHFYSHQ